MKASLQVITSGNEAFICKSKWVCWQAAWPTILDIWSAGNLPRRANPIKYHLQMSQREHIAALQMVGFWDS